MDRRTALAIGLTAAGALALGTSAWMTGADAASPDPQIGAPAPAFTAVDSKGQKRSLADFRGKTVVLEWTNHDCPFVRKHYETGNMQALQKETTGQGVVWLTIGSSATGEQGYVTGAEADALTQKRGAAPSAFLLDPQGSIGKAYNAKVTPHMYVIDPKGTLVYMGGIDDKPTTRHADVQGARNYVREALAAMSTGKPIAATSTRAYGCTIKYSS